ncbi:carboxymuconolactone decarboxylase family protein [Thiohalophilus sp.]|uniref:carboxymuconolactone decarboxylase family protein n=1 Tax=Thiohalophilus sp. TaxID=3028392 RepID=UPI002ACDE2B4|nr:carboxymuconolactone decarboxylase family protein [Thiohalophilus sp.]MDZ7662084.1 carboxymuconolactone decarboxylase family protein [Thiohalophilus sp.]
MTLLSERDKELVAIGAAIGSNCIPCIEYHIPAAQKAGIEDHELNEAIEIANKVKNVPAKKVYEAALEMLSGKSDASNNGTCCGN